MPARTPQKLCGPYQQSAKSKLHLPRLTSSSLALEGQTQTCSQFSRWFRHCCSAPLCNTDTTNTSAPTVVTGPNLYFIDVCTVTLDKWTQYSSECTWLEREITFSYFFLSFFFFSQSQKCNFSFPHTPQDGNSWHSTSPLYSDLFPTLILTF